jgi:hypothetical protein
MTPERKSTFRHQKPRPQASEYEFFTGGGTTPDKVSTKIAPFTIYYNIALENVNRIKDQLEGQSEEQRYNFWAEYLWKAHAQSKNSNGYKVTAADKSIIDTLIGKGKGTDRLVGKVEEIRNFHSHIWHDNSILHFEGETKKFIEQKYNEAKAKLYRDSPGNIADFENILQKKAGKYDVFDNGSRLKPEGRAFLLSFFLTTGQMNSFLQQRTGYKRNDLPQFKMTRLLYTEYCHRDGAARSEFNHSDRMINSLDKNMQADVLKARTAFKLISYLVDYPDYWGSREAMPLLTAENEPIKNMEELKIFIEERGLLPGLNFSLIERTIVPDETDDKLKEQRIKEYEDKYRQGMIAFTYAPVEGYTFHINFESLYRLALLKLLPLPDETDPAVTLDAELKKLAERRRTLYSILIKKTDERTDEDNAFLSLKENQYLRGGRRLTEKGVQFFESLERGYAGKYDEAILLANYLRDDNTAAISLFDKKGVEKTGTAAEPIQVYGQDFILGRREKFRAGNRLVFYTAKFLVDFAGDKWYWGMEKFDNEPNKKTGNISLAKKKVYLKASDIPADEDYRLTLENDHIFIGIPKKANGEKNHEKFHQLALGPKAIRYLGAYMVDQPNDYAEKISEFFEALATDLSKLAADEKFKGADGYHLLEKPFVSAFMKPAGNNYNQLKGKFKNRVDYIKGQWRYALDNLQYISRAEKNRMIMDAYRLFDWAQDRRDGKFLRADEYNQLSVCHYCLHVRINDKNKRKTMTFEHLYNNLFELNKRQPPIPSEIKDLLFSAKDIDDLLAKVTDDRKAFLNNKLDLPERFLKKELPKLCRNLGISVPAELLAGDEQNGLAKKHRETFDILPYSVHPMLVVKFFFGSEYADGRELVAALDKNKRPINKRPVLEIFNKIRADKGLTSVLNSAYYDSGLAVTLYPHEMQRTCRHKLTGLLNNTKTEDAILWWMARQYLAGNEYTREMAGLVETNPHLKIDNLHNVSIGLELKRGTEEKKGKKGELLDPLEKSLYVSLRMHQFDDMMFMTDKLLLRKAAVHFTRRCYEEKPLWKEEMKTMKEKQFENKEIPDGSSGDPLPYQLLRDEISLVHRTGQKLADYMLDFEKKLFQQKLETGHNGNEHNFQKWLLAEFPKWVHKTDPKPHFPFRAALELAGDSHLAGINKLKYEMTGYRNTAFHDDIPLKGSFSWYTREGSPYARCWV